MTDRDVSFDPIIDDEVVDTVKTAADGPVFVVVEFTPDEFRLAYASTTTREMYEDEAAMYDYFERVHEYVNLDLAENDLFTERLFPTAEEVRYIATAMDIGKMIRVYVEDERGIFVGLPTDAEVEPVVGALLDTLDR